MTEIGYYNYYKEAGRYTPDTVQDHYQQMVERYNSDELHANNENPYSKLNLARRELDEKLSVMAESVRGRFKNKSEVHEYLCKKYFGTSDIPYTMRQKEPEKYAMLENDLNAICYGTIGGGNLNDPRLNYTQQNWADYEAEESSSKHDSISGQMKNLLKNNGITIPEGESLILSFNPYNYGVKVEGLSDKDLSDRIAGLLNSGSNSKELMYWALQNSQNVDADALTKFRAYQNLKEYTGLDISEMTLKNGEFYTPNGQKVTDILKERLDDNTEIGLDFKGAAYEYVKNLLDKTAEKGWNAMPDLDLKVGFTLSCGFYTFGVERFV